MRQTLLVPLAAELSREDGALLLENLPLLEEFGFTCEDFGDDTVLVREVPADIDAADTTATLEAFAEDLRAGRTGGERRHAVSRSDAELVPQGGRLGLSERRRVRHERHDLLARGARDARTDRLHHDELFLQRFEAEAAVGAG